MNADTELQVLLGAAKGCRLLRRRDAQQIVEYLAVAMALNPALRAIDLRRVEA